MLFWSLRLRPLQESLDEPVLEFFPQELTIFEIIQVILICVGRQCLALLGFGNQFKVSKNGDDGLESYSLPELRLSMPFRVAKKDFLKYAAALGCPGADASVILSDPAQTCVMLSAFSEPTFLLLLAHHKCPVLPLGSVNVRNRFELLRFDLCSPDLLLDQSSYEARARLIPSARRVKRGLEIDTEVEIVQLKTETTIFRQVFTILQFTKFKSKAKAPFVVNDDPQKDLFEQGVDDELVYAMEKAPIARWASICMDYNPIHISDLAARIFGFSGRILHGNHALASGLHFLQAHKAQLTYDPGARQETWVTSVQFRRPIAAPASLTFQVRHETNGSYHFRVLKEGIVCTVGSVQYIS